jgi:hypothetical protein
MKSTYNLLSIYLDHKPVLDTNLHIENNSEFCTISDLSEEYSLFDYPVCCRKVSGKFLLSTNNFSEIECYLNKLPVCHRLFIILDQEPISIVVGQLFAKRILQVAEMIKKRLPSTVLTIVANPENMSIYQNIFDSF